MNFRYTSDRFYNRLFIFGLTTFFFPRHRLIYKKWFFDNSLSPKGTDIMIRLSNGHSFEYVVASGALGFDGAGYWWERPLAWCGLLKPHLFTVIMKTITCNPRAGYFRWSKPWASVRLLRGGSVVNKFGLTNKGIEWWCHTIGPTVNPDRIPLVASLYGTPEELAKMAALLNNFNFVAIELNLSCPNTEHGMPAVHRAIQETEAVKNHSRHPVIIKVSVAQDYCAIAKAVLGMAEAIDLNSVPWELIYPKETGIESPLTALQRVVGGGGGGVSGMRAQKHNWRAVSELALNVPALPVIAPSIMEYDDLARVRNCGAQAISFGSIHMRTPWKPTRIVERELRERACVSS